ncbi:hypothetical protein JHK87_022279 [Glycine soja]|nr:hypothetical protein JHK87_022279 [Glycine soja]
MMLFAKTAIVVVGDLGDTLGSNTGPLIQEKAETILISSPLDSTAQTGQSSGGDWQEQIKSMKESYLPELNEMYQKIATQLQQHNSLPTQPKLDQLEKMNVFKMLERIIAFLQVSKSNISPNFKEKLEKLGSYENHIINFINRKKHKKAMPSMQSRQLPLPHIDWQ